MPTLAQKLKQLVAGKPANMQAKFDVAQTTSQNAKHWANADSLSARASVSPTVRKVVRTRSRYEADNNSWYSGMIRTAVNHIVGKGPRLQVMTGDPEIDSRIELAFRRWADKAQFSRLLRAACETYWKDGEVFVRRIAQDHHNAVPLGLQLIEADQIASPWTHTVDPLIDDGIRLDANTRELSYHVLTTHPGTAYATSRNEGDWLDAEHMVHLFRALRPGQTRGIPRATAGLQMLPIMRRQELATLYGAETAANFAMVLKTNSPTIAAATSNAAFEEMELATNMVTSLPAGWDINTIGSNLPGPDYESFQRQALQAFSRCTNMPYALAAGTGRDSNFSSLKGDMKNVWEPEVQVEQSDIETSVANPVFQWFLEAAIYHGSLLHDAPPIEQIDHRWVWPPLPELDAINAAKAAALRLSTGQSVPSDEHGQRGQDWDTQLQRGSLDYGISVDELKSAIFAKTFSLQKEMAPRTEPTEQVSEDNAVADEPHDIQASDASTDTVEMTADFRLMAAGESSQRRFEILAYSGGYLPVEAYGVPVIIDLAGLEATAGVPILIDHKKSVETTLGITDEIHNDGKTLSLTGLITGTSEIAKQVLAQDKAGHTWQASIGAQVLAEEEVTSGQQVTVNGQTLQGPAIVGRRAVLRETSVLPMGADRTTTVNLAAAAATLLEETAEMTFEKFLSELGLSMDDLSDERRAALELAHGAEYPADSLQSEVIEEPETVTASAGVLSTDMTQSLQELNRQAAAQFARHADIGRIARKHPKIAAKAIEAGWSNDKVELEVLKADKSKTRPTSFGSQPSTSSVTPGVLEAAVCMQRKHNDAETRFDDQTLQAAHTNFRRGLGLQQLFLQAAAMNGMDVAPGQRVTKEVMQYAFGHNVQAAFSSVDMGTMLENIANKELLEGYEEVEASWRSIAKIKPVSNLQTATSYRMTDDGEYEELSPTGQIKHGQLGTETYTRQAKTYAKMFALTRTDMINDDLGAFDDLRNRVGGGAHRKLNRVFWAQFLDNSAFFTAARGNYITGSTTTLLDDGVGLGLALDAFDALRTPAADGAKVPGGLVGGSPSILLTPGGGISRVAENFHANTNMGSVKNADANIHAGRYTPVKSVFLNDSSIANSSALAWYLLRDPATAPSMVVSFLNGIEQPTVESSEADFASLGVLFRGFHDFGCDQAEYLAGVKSKGAA